MWCLKNIEKWRTCFTYPSGNTVKGTVFFKTIWHWLVLSFVISFRSASAELVPKLIKSLLTKPDMKYIEKNTHIYKQAQKKPQNIYYCSNVMSCFYYLNIFKAIMLDCLILEKPSFSLFETLVLHYPELCQISQFCIWNLLKRTQDSWDSEKQQKFPVCF